MSPEPENLIDIVEGSGKPYLGSARDKKFGSKYHDRTDEVQTAVGTLKDDSLFEVKQRIDKEGKVDLGPYYRIKRPNDSKTV